MIRVFTITALVSFLFAALLSPAHAVKNPSYEFWPKHCWAVGDVIKQPPGSGIQACCYDDGCWICDEYWGDCEFERASGKPAKSRRPIFQPNQPQVVKPPKPKVRKPNAGTFQGNQSLMSAKSKFRAPYDRYGRGTFRRNQKLR